jgi:uroporphyrinogen-III synthase
MLALVTRPREDAATVASRLQALGIEAQIEPLIEIAPRQDVALDLAGVQVLLFTSANGVRAFAALSARRDLKVLTVGDGSAEAAGKAGFTDTTSAAGNVESLATLAADRLNPGDGFLLHAGGSTLAGDLQGRLEQAGFETRRAILYDAIPAKSFSPEVQMNLRLGGIDLVLFFSPRSARIFAALWRQGQAAQGVSSGLDRARALCLSAAVAREIDDLGARRNGRTTGS